MAPDMPPPPAPTEGAFQLALRPPPPPQSAQLTPLPKLDTVLPRLVDESAPGIVQFVYQGDGLTEQTELNLINLLHSKEQSGGHLAQLAKKVDITQITDPGLDHLVAAYNLKRPKYKKEQCFCIIHGDTIATLGPNAHDMDECFVLINNQEPFREMKRQAQLDAGGSGQRQRASGSGSGPGRVNFGGGQQGGAQRTFARCNFFYRALLRRVTALLRRARRELSNGTSCVA